MDQGQRQRPADDCRSMDDVRAEIDRVDERLVDLLAERQTYIEAAGRIKSQKSAVRDDARIEDVVGKVLEKAEKSGLSKRIAEPVWRELIDRSIDHEHQIWDSVHAASEKK